MMNSGLRLAVWGALGGALAAKRGLKNFCYLFWDAKPFFEAKEPLVSVLHLIFLLAKPVALKQHNSIIFFFAHFLLDISLFPCYFGIRSLEILIS